MIPLSPPAPRAVPPPPVPRRDAQAARAKSLILHTLRVWTKWEREIWAMTDAELRRVPKDRCPRRTEIAERAWKRRHPTLEFKAETPSRRRQLAAVA